MKTGFYISGAGHAALIVWILFGGLFLRAEDSVTLENTQVSLLTAEEFAALTAPENAPEIGANPTLPKAPEVEAPQQPDPTEIVQETPKAPEQPDAPEAPSVAPDVEQAPNSIVSPEPLTVPLAPIAPTASPRPSQRVAPQPVITETPDAAVDTIAQEATETTDAPVEKPAEEVERTTAPEEASDRIVAEAAAPPASAPESSPRPPSRPQRTEPVEVAEPAEPPKPVEPEQTTSQNDDILAALSEANSTPAEAPQAAVPSGPPLSEGERDALRISVSRCWNVGTLSNEALRTTVVVGLNMGRDGKPDNGSLHLLGSNGGSQASANQAYEAARRAIIRCGNEGFDLPAEKYDHWKEIEITFDPEKMRNR